MFYLVKSNKDPAKSIARVTDLDEYDLTEILEIYGYTIDYKDDETLDTCILFDDFEIVYLDRKGRVFAFVDRKYHIEFEDILEYAGIEYYFCTTGMH